MALAKGPTDEEEEEGTTQNNNMHYAVLLLMVNFSTTEDTAILTEAYFPSRSPSLLFHN